MFQNLDMAVCSIGTRAAWTMGTGLALLTSGCILYDPLCFGDFSSVLRNNPDFMTTLDQWRAEVEENNCDTAPFFMVTGACDNDGLRFLSRSGGFGANTLFFDETGKIVGLIVTTDFPIPPCFGRRTIPLFLKCENGTITEVLCGEVFAVEDSFNP